MTAREVKDYLIKYAGEKCLCIVCGNKCEYEIGERQLSGSFKGQLIENAQYFEAYCKNCGTYMEVPGLWDLDLDLIKQNAEEIKNETNHNF